MDKRLRWKIADYYENRFQGKMFNEQHVLSEFNPLLRRILRNFNCKEMFLKVPFFKNLPSKVRSNFDRQSKIFAIFYQSYMWFNPRPYQSLRWFNGETEAWVLFIPRSNCTGRQSGNGLIFHLQRNVPGSVSNLPASKNFKIRRTFRRALPLVTRYQKSCECRLYKRHLYLSVNVQIISEGFLLFIFIQINCWWLWYGDEKIS